MKITRRFTRAGEDVFEACVGEEVLEGVDDGVDESISRMMADRMSSYGVA